MNRRGFLKAFAGTGVAAVAAPLVALAGKEYAIGGVVGPAFGRDPMMLSGAEHIVPTYKGRAYMVVTQNDLLSRPLRIPDYSFTVRP